MATGRGTQLTKQVGEYLVAAELCRRGLIATTFTGNVPHYDIIASSEKGGHVPVQVKASNGSSWHLNLGSFVEVSMRGKKQVLGRAKREPCKNLICVFVALEEYGADRFFVLSWRRLRGIVIRGHKRYLAKHGGRRPKTPDSMHSGQKVKHLAHCEDNWDVIDDALSI